MGVGPGHPCVVIAEAGVNHNGSVEIAHRLVDAALGCGADVVKFQAFKTDALVTPASRKAVYQVANTGKGGSQEEMLRSLELSQEDHVSLMEHCEDVGILYLCTPYDNASADMLERMNVAAFKIASTDATNVAFLRYLGEKARPLIFSTGMMSAEELDVAMAAIGETPARDETILLHCTSAYPSPPHQSNLCVMSTMTERYDLPVGFSDHTPGIEISVLAVAAGASMIEKHLTLDKAAPGPDHKASLDPSEFKVMIDDIRRCEAALGDGVKRITAAEMENKNVLQKGIYAIRPIHEGAVITAEDVACKRPVAGLSAIEYDRVVGSRASTDIAAGSPITDQLIHRVNRAGGHP